MKSKMIECKACGQEISSGAKSCPHCGERNKKSKSKGLLIVIAIIVIASCIAGALSSNSNTSTTTSNNNSTSKNNSSVSTNAKSVYDGDCGVSASAEIGNNIINYPELKIAITNTSKKEIAAIKFHAVPYDVYGDEIKGWTTQNELYTDTPISAGSSTTISYQFIEQSVHTVKLYIYSVYFSDGSEWGNRNATTSNIIGNAPTINVTVVD